jgi:hypothetical protein
MSAVVRRLLKDCVVCIRLSVVAVVCLSSIAVSLDIYVYTVTLDDIVNQISVKLLC